ncbi:MAG: fibronectin type III domain-containing protein, partial [Pseudomonadota bacterium]|nr:fibronectin type III domain-containing protein [Pseudomonadota bacterium]
MDIKSGIELSRRNLLLAAGIGMAVKVVPNFMSEANAAPAGIPQLDPRSVSPIANLHLQFGSDATSEMIVSWHSLAPVQNPRVLLGSMSGKLEKTVAATVVSYVDDKSK